MVLKAMKKMMLVGEGNPGTKEIVIDICDTYLPVGIAKAQFKVDGLINLRSPMTSRIVIWAV